MSIPGSLKRLIDEISTEMLAADDRQIAPEQIAAIHAAFGLPIDPISNRARGNLAILTAEHVIPIWKASLLDESTPEGVLALARDLLAGKADLNAAYDSADHAEFAIGQAVDNMDLDLGSYSFQADFAGRSTLHALDYVIHLYCFTRKIPLHGYLELDADDLIGPWTAPMITAFHAYAGIEADEYGEWSGKFDPAKCEEFWSWWLREAIPAVWE